MAESLWMFILPNMVYLRCWGPHSHIIYVHNIDQHSLFHAIMSSYNEIWENYNDLTVLPHWKS